MTHNHGACGWENGAQFIAYWTGQSPMWGNYTTQTPKDGEVLLVFVR